VLQILSLLAICTLATAFMVVCLRGFNGALHERPSYQSSFGETGFANRPLSVVGQEFARFKKPADNSEAA